MYTIDDARAYHALLTVDIDVAIKNAVESAIKSGSYIASIDFLDFVGSPIDLERLLTVRGFKDVVVFARVHKANPVFKRDTYNATFTWR